MNPIKIRPLLEEDFDVFVRVACEGYGENAEKFGYPGTDITMDFLKSEADNCKMFFGFFENDIPVGILELGVDDNFDSCIEMLAVLPEYRRKSYGLTLLDYAAFRVEESAMNILTAYVNKDDSYTIKWFEKYGFNYDGNGKLTLNVRNRKHCCH